MEDRIGDIQRLLGRLAREGRVLSASPETIRELVEMGVIRRKAGEPTLKESLDAFLEHVAKKAPQIAARLPSPPSGHPSIGSLYGEIRRCIMFGLYGAAITLCAILVEYALKYAAYAREVGGLQKYDASLWDKYEKKSFGSAIQAADKAKLLTHDLKRRLKSFADDIRNPYAHYNIKKITEGAVATKVKKLKLATRQIQEEDIPAVESPVVQAWTKPLVDADKVFPVFSFADEVVGHLLSQIDA